MNFVIVDFFRNNSNKYKLYRINCCYFVKKDIIKVVIYFFYLSGII